jgi:hypothetical protein
MRIAWPSGPGWLFAALAIGCGGEIDLPGPCHPQEPPPEAIRRANDKVPTDDGEATVLPNGRLVLPRRPAIADLKLGHPVDMIAHPTRSIVYVADARYFMDGEAERCPAQSAGGACPDESAAGVIHSRRRGIHVIDVEGTPKEIQDPSMMCIDKLDHPPGPACPDGHIPYDGAFGLAMTRDGKALYASTGLSGYVLRFDVSAMGWLTLSHAIPVQGFTAGLALSPDEKSLFVVRFLGAKAVTASSIAEIALVPNVDDPMLPVPRLLDQNVELQGFGAYGCVAVPEGDFGVRLWVSGFRDGPVQSVARQHEGEPLKDLLVFDAGKNPEGIARYGKDMVAVAVSDADQVVLLHHRAKDMDRPEAIELAGKPIRVGDYLAAKPAPIGASPTQLVVDGDRAYVTLASDNAVSIVDLAHHAEQGVVGVGQDPSAVALTAIKGGSRRLVVANGKSPYGPQCPGGATACTPDPPPEPDPLSEMDACWIDTASVAARVGSESCDGTNPTPTRPDVVQAFYLDETHEEGTLTVLHPALDIDAALDQTTQIAKERIEHPAGTYDSGCGDRLFPIPTETAITPIRHVVLVIRENKTYDFLLGDLGPDGQGQPREGRKAFAVDAIRAGKHWPRITPNLHALAERFTSLDNFYDDAEVSMQGHSWATRGFVNDYLERIHLEENARSAFFDFPFQDEAAFGGAETSYGSFFSHLLRNRVSFRIFGEVVGALGHVNDDFVVNHLDFKLGGNDREHSDIDKAEHVVEELTADGGAPAFSYVLLPRDHTEGLEPGRLSPVSMIAENDVATGKLVEGISRNEDLWKSTVIFIVEDDSLQGYDHVDYHRSICLVVSPWARHAHNSRVHASYPALFHTIEKILGLGPMNRFDAYAPILWDAFTAEPAKSDFDPFTAECARVPLDAKVPACPTSMNDDADEREEVEIDERPDIDRAVFGAVTGSPFGTQMRVE